MRLQRTLLPLLLLILATACVAPDHSPADPVTDDVTRQAIDALKAELSDPRALKLSARLHRQSVEERIDHVDRLLQWLHQSDITERGGEDPAVLSDFEPQPRIDTAFTIAILDIENQGPIPTPEAAYGRVFAVTEASVEGILVHHVEWDYDRYVEEPEVPEHLAYDTIDATTDTRLMTLVGCFYIPNETTSPSDSVDYWLAAKTHHVYIVEDATTYYREDRRTEDFEDTRNPTPRPEVIPCNGLQSPLGGR